MYRVIPCLIAILALTSFTTQSPNGFRLFEFVSSILQKDYINPRGFDIPKTVETYRAELRKVCPQDATCSLDAGRDVAGRMLESLDDAHLVLFDDTSEGKTFVGAPNSSGRFGFFLERDATTLYVSDVYPESPADRAGLRMGDRIVSVNGKSDAPRNLEMALRATEIEYREARLEVVRQQTKFTATLRASFTSPFLPVVEQLAQETYRVRIYALGLNYFDQAVHGIVGKLNAAGAKNIVLDLRYNEGGTSIASMKVAAAFTAPPERILVTKDGERYALRYAAGVVEWRDLANPSETGVYEGKLEQPQLFKGQVVVLTSKRTYSAGEHLAYIMQSTKRAKVFGDRTAGGMDTSATYKWFENNNDVMFYGDRAYQNLDGSWFPPRVTPDVTIQDSLSGLGAGRDSALDAAVKSFATSTAPK